MLTTTILAKTPEEKLDELIRMKEATREIMDSIYVSSRSLAADIGDILAEADLIGAEPQVLNPLWLALFHLGGRVSAEVQYQIAAAKSMARQESDSALDIAE